MNLNEAATFSVSEDAHIDATWINTVCDASKSYITRITKGASVCEEQKSQAKPIAPSPSVLSVFLWLWSYPVNI